METSAAATGTAVEGDITLLVAPSMASFSREEWGKLAGASRDISATPYNPFISFDFLNILEESGTVGQRTGWQPQHLRLQDASAG